MLVTSIFSFYHHAFKKPLIQGCYKSGLSGKESLEKQHWEKRNAGNQHFLLTQCFFAHLTLKPNDKILDWSKLKAIADDKIKVLKMIFFFFDRVENIVEKGENAGYQHFLLFPQCFQTDFYPGLLKVGTVW